MINLITTYKQPMLEAFSKSSFTAGNATSDYDFIGEKTIRILSPVTQAPGNYTRSGIARYGTPTDVQDIMQEMSLANDKSYSLVIDKGDRTQQGMMKTAGRMMTLQQREQVAPMIDKYNLLSWAQQAGKVLGFASALDKTTIIAALLACEAYFDDNLVPADDRYVYMANATYAYVRLANEFVGCDNLTNQLIIKGYRGNINTLKIITVPASYIPTGVYFLATYKGSVIAPHQLHTANIHEDPPGISGHLMEGRDIFDAFVLGRVCNGVYAAVAAANKAAAPTLAKSGTTTLTSTTGSAVIKYTLDGTDPRYSSTALTYSAAITNPTAGTIVTAVAYYYAGNYYYSI